MKKVIIVLIIIAGGVAAYLYYGRMEGGKEKLEMTVDELYAAGHVAFDGTQYEKMFDYYNEALKRDPDNPAAEDAYMNMARYYENEHDFKMANKMYTSYLQRFPKGEYRDLAEKAALRTELRQGNP
jgi:outer membrane protein assembly factor BamD (BamD/ComL family)